MGFLHNGRWHAYCCNPRCHSGHNRTRRLYRFRVTRVRYEVAHDLAVADGGSNQAANLVILCRRCHKRQGRRDMVQFTRGAYRRPANWRERRAQPLAGKRAVEWLRQWLRQQGNAVGVFQSSAWLHRQVDAALAPDRIMHLPVVRRALPQVAQRRRLWDPNTKRM